MANAHREDNEQAALIEWAKVANVNGIKPFDHLFAIPNGGKRNKNEAARMKGQGVKAGVSDLFLRYPSGGHHGLFIELKAPKTRTQPAGKITAQQQQWLDSSRALGYGAVLCEGWQPAMKTIIAYLRGEPV
jgi:hypothetical protein